MKLSYGCYIFLIFLVLKCRSQTTVHVPSVSENPGDEFEQFDDSFPHCFRFTWLGPDYKKDSEFNGTCKEKMKNNKAKNIPCRQPLVITDNGTVPNMDYLFKYHRDKVLCRRSSGQTCVKYSYYFNDILQNVTYMCAKVVSINEGAENTGCWSQTENGYETKVCMCLSTPGNIKPCNSGHSLDIQFLFIIFIAIFTIFNLYQ